MSLPPPSQNQQFCNVSALDAGSARAPLAWILEGVPDDVKITLPALAFLLRHSTKADAFLLDLGIRKDWQALPLGLMSRITDTMQFEIFVEQDAVEALVKGGVQLSDVTHVCYSHLHFDHIGDSAPFKHSQFVVGEPARAIVSNGYPTNPNGIVPIDLLPEGRTTFLDPAGWPALGPFPHALDFYGDGSLYVVDAGSGHMPGHLNVLARTSADGGWIYLAGDSAHDWRIIKGEGKVGRHGIFGCAHMNVEETEQHLARIRTLMEKNPRVRVLLAHDKPWYEENKGGPAFLPGKIESL